LGELEFVSLDSFGVLEGAFLFSDMSQTVTIQRISHEYTVNIAMVPNYPYRNNNIDAVYAPKIGSSVWGYNAAV
jgi:hypothetical protein